MEASLNAPPASPPPGRPPRLSWLLRIEMLGTTITVLLIGALMLWFNALDHGRHDSMAIGAALVAYLGVLVLLGRRAPAPRPVYLPFALAGLASGTVAQLINGQFRIHGDLGVVAVTGLFVGTMHWLALRVWLRLVDGRAA